VTRRETFVAERRPQWQELDELVRRAGRRPARLGAVGVLRLGACYRSVSADLALARRAYPGDPVVAQLDQLVSRARHVVYDAVPRRAPVRDFVVRGYWRRVRERPGLLALSAVMLLGSMALAGWWGWRDPGAAARVVPAEYGAVTEPRPAGADLGIPADEQAELAGVILTNNIRVSFLAFAGGILLGIGTAWTLLLNGVLIGAITGVAVEAGNGRAFLELVVAHGVLELSCIVVAGAAGLRLGDGLLHPGNRRRGAALRDEARAAVEMVLGTAALLVVAGLVEGFVTPAGLGTAPVVAIGVGLGVAFWALVGARGRPASTAARSASA
jgi:uncharacterized membrane protein SpoIIM required for sporulation